MKNIKFFIALALFALFANQMNAQVKVFAGAKAGLNLSTLTSEDDEEEGRTALPGGVFGATLEFSFFDRVSLQTEALFMRKGARVEIKDIATTETKLNYLEFPALLKVTVNKNADRDVQVYAGPSFGLFKKYKESLKTEIKNAIVVSNLEDADFQEVETSLALGICARGKVKTGYVTADLRAMMSLSPAIKTAAFGDYRNVGVAVSLGYCLLLNP